MLTLIVALALLVVLGIVGIIVVGIIGSGLFSLMIILIEIWLVYILIKAIVKGIKNMMS